VPHELTWLKLIGSNAAVKALVRRKYPFNEK
jgi:hypothetical protein